MAANTSVHQAAAQALAAQEAAQDAFINSVQLPDINVIAGVEISDGVDGSLPKSKKLPLVATGNREQTAAYTAMVVYESQELGHKGHRAQRDFMTNCAYALASLGLLRASSLSAYSEEEIMGRPTFHMNAETQADRADTASTLSGERAFTRATAHKIRCHIDKPPSLSAFCYTDAHRVLKHTAYMITDTAEPEDSDWRVFNGTLPIKKPDGFDGTAEINKVQAALWLMKHTAYMITDNAEPEDGD